MVKVKLIQGNVLEALKQIPDNSIDCIITSPPYWGLRKYPDDANIIWDGDPNCQHEWETYERKGQSGGTKSEKVHIKGLENFQIVPNTQQAFCKKCGAWFGQLGLEPTLELYIQHLLQITAELKRVLKPTGVMFWNHGDCYSSYLGKHAGRTTKERFGGRGDINDEDRPPKPKKYPTKCLMGQNYRLILKMVDEQGWIWRNTIIWHKPNHLPSSVKDRFTSAYEPIFMLVKSKKYFFNLDAVREPLKSLKNHSFNIRVREAKKGHFEKIGVRASEEEMGKYDNKGQLIKHDIAVGRIGNFSYADSLHEVPYNILGKNPSDVWTINTEPFPEAHFATFPTELVRRCIKCGCSEAICKKCGHIKTPIINKSPINIRKHELHKGRKKDAVEGKLPEIGIVGFKRTGVQFEWKREIKGYNDCEHKDYEPGWVLDPFVGSGTTIKVAIEERRNVIGIEIVKDYIDMAIKRCNLRNNPFIDFELIKV